MRKKFVIVDLETTGNIPANGDRIIQFAAVIVENGKIIDKFSSFVNPEQPIPAFIEELTGVNDEMVINAPLFSEIAAKIASILEDAFFVAHNVMFDLSFLQEELERVGEKRFDGPIIDTVELSRILFPTEDSYKLSDLSLKAGFKHERPHQADSDAFVTAELLLTLMERLRSLPLSTLRQLYPFADYLKSDFDLLLIELLQEKQYRTEQIKSTIEFFHGIALCTYDNEDAILQNTILEYPKDDIGKEQLLKENFPKYEKRTGQFQMMDRVYSAFRQARHALIEAGTGIGKSLAYLLPAVFLAKKNGVPVMVSTYTTQLQEQLLQKDIPLLKKCLPFSFKAALLKGKSHYLHLGKFIDSLTDYEDNFDTALAKMQILVWLTETKSGDVDELHLSSGGKLYWSKINCAEGDYLQKKIAPEKDFYLRAQNAAAAADIIITNHSLLIADIAADFTLLPDYQHVIVDEGHHFHDIAGRHLGHSLHYLQVRKNLAFWGMYEQKQLFYKIEKVLAEKNIPGIMESEKLNLMIHHLFSEMDELFKTIAIYTARYGGRYAKKRISSLFKQDNSKESTAVMATVERFSFLLGDFITEMKKRLQLLTNTEANLKERCEKGIASLETIKADLRALFHSRSPHITWMEADKRIWQNGTKVFAEPVSAAPLLKEKFFKKKQSVVITSATLAVNGSFSYMSKQLGVEENRTESMIIASPYQYDQQCKVVVVKDLPAINEVAQDEYISAITEYIISIAEAAKGRMLVLFTAYEMLQTTYELLKESGLLEDFSLMAQGITAGSRNRLTRNFQRYEKAILLATNSFWEGIDIPGEDLSFLVIVRLPFSSPNEPVTAAKIAKIKEQCGNPFTEISLPEAVLRFKQGFGRLIRSHTDRGVIIIFDRRIVTASYGTVFLQSIPDVPVQEWTEEELTAFIKDTF
ncbi:ATP-dependent DNA helicase DinG [Bacillaceae bacterium Marseille-Q3522]|nr:ATP-dependent DNA helicase DinG [Bacillaceae bacterium Marseille-Q3522]